MEQDIKVLEEMVEKSRDLKEEDFYKLIGIKQIQSISNFIKAYKELEEENSMLKKANNIRENITEEDIEKAIKEASKKYIPVSLVEEKTEELNKEEKELQDSITEEEREEYLDASIGYGLMLIENQRKVLQELLEKR